MAGPVIIGVNPPDQFNTFPIGGKIEIRFDQEISEFLAENSITLIGAPNHTVTGPELQEKKFRFGNEAGYESVLDSLFLNGEIPIDIEFLKCDSDYLPLEDQKSYDIDLDFKTKLIIRPKGFLEEKTKYTVILSGGASAADDWGYIGSKSVYDAEEVFVSGEGLIKTSGYSVTEDVIHIEVKKTGSSITAKFEWWLESSPTVKYDLFPFSGRNKIAKEKDIYFEFVGGTSDAFIEGDTWTVKIYPVEYMEDAYKFSFETAAEQVKELPVAVSQSPIGLDAPSQEEILAGQTEFQLVKIEPEYAASNISRNTSQIILTFNKNLDPTSINADSVRLFRNIIDANADAIEVGYSWIVSGKKLIINITRE
jgi:hypothetical protein